MTTGSTTEDLRINVNTDAGPGKTGSYRTKSWNGADYPKAKPSYTNVYFYDGFSNKPRRKRVWVKPPHRARTVEHPYTMSLLTKTDNILQWSDNSGALYRTGTFENMFGPPPATLTWTANDEIALLGKLRQKIVGSSFNPAVFLGEGHQALEMIFNAANRISKALRAVSSGNFRKAHKALTGNSKGFPKASANSWLGLQYGWLPLLNDAYDGAQFLAHLTSAPFQHVVTATHAKRAQGAPAVSHIRLKYGSELVSVKIKAILKEVDIIALSGLTDPAEVMWEKLPYSFVVDWFIPIGNYLQARGLAQGLKGTFVRSQFEKQWVMGQGCKSIYSFFLVRDSVYSFQRITLTRTVTTSLQVPLPEVKPLSAVPSWRRAANAVALLYQAITR